MSRIAVRLDGELDAFARAAAAAEHVTLSEFVRRLLARESDRRRALQARAEEDARGPLYSGAQEELLLAARARQHVQFENAAAEA